MADWQKPETLALWLTIGVTLVLFLVVVLILFTRIYINRILTEQQEKSRLKLDHQKDLLKDSIRVQERERNRIAADLHDGLISKLNVLLLTIHGGESSGNNSTVLLRESIGLARRISHDLSPPLLEETNLSDLIADFISPLRKTIEVDYYLSEYSDEPVLNEVKLQLLRIVQEIISNSIKHSNANKMMIHLRHSAKMIGLRIADNGCGFDVDEMHKGLGQKNIEMRVQLLRGDYRLKSVPKWGTAYLIYVHV